MNRRYFITGVALSVPSLQAATRSALLFPGGGSTGLSSDGSIIIGQSGGGGSGTLYTRYGTWTSAASRHSSPAIAFWHFFEAPRSGEVYDIGGGRHCNCSMREAIERCQSLTGRELQWSHSDYQ
jgi:CDP-paratose 2-epimerase